MGTYRQADRPLTVTTPLGADALLLIGVRGHEAISGLFRFDLPRRKVMSGVFGVASYALAY